LRHLQDHLLFIRDFDTVGFGIARFGQSKRNATGILVLHPHGIEDIPLSVG
jgi:hypothetical protein